MMDFCPVGFLSGRDNSGWHIVGWLTVGWLIVGRLFGCSRFFLAEFLQRWLFFGRLFCPGGFLSSFDFSTGG